MITVVIFIPRAETIAWTSRRKTSTRKIFIAEESRISRIMK